MKFNQSQYNRVSSSTTSTYNQSELELLKTPNHLFLETPEDISYLITQPTTNHPNHHNPKPMLHPGYNEKKRTKAFAPLCKYAINGAQDIPMTSWDVSWGGVPVVPWGSPTSLRLDGWICINLLFANCRFFLQIVYYRSYRPAPQKMWKKTQS